MKLEWRTYLEHNGHLWEHGYFGNLLVEVRCKRCGKHPIELMRGDLSLRPCIQILG